MRAFLLVFLAILTIGTCQAQESSESNTPNLTGAGILPACKEYLKEQPNMGPAEIFCGAVIMTVMTTTNFKGAYLVCIPQGVTMEQGVKVVVASLERYPEMLHNDFIMLATYILNKTWPCEKPAVGVHT